MSRTHRRIAKAIVPREDPSAKTKVRVGKIVSVSGSTATVEINADIENPVAGVPIAPGLAVAAGQVVELTFTGRAPMVTDRIS